jgi:hypothetical protein
MYMRISEYMPDQAAGDAVVGAVAGSIARARRAVDTARLCRAA